MEHKFMNFEMAMLAMQAAQYIKALEGYHVSSTIVAKNGYIELRIFSEQPDVVCLPDGYLYSEREFRNIGFVKDTEWFNTNYYFNF